MDLQAAASRRARRARRVDKRVGHVYYLHMASREVIRRLKADGWYKVAQRGSHVQFKHPTKPGRVTVPHPKKNIPAGTLRSISRQAGIPLP